MKRFLFAFVVLMMVMSGVVLAQPSGKAFGFYGCDSAGATSATPGQWFKELKANPVAGGVLLGLNPAELAELENSTEGWTGYGITPNVGALINNFCGSSSIK
jgi:hypothetical protein